MKILEALESLSSCNRAQVACVIVDTRFHIMGTGYNGQPSYLDNFCNAEEGGCGCIHAEANALMQMRTDGHGIHTLFCTYSPCVQCAGLIINKTVIAEVIFKKKYRNTRGIELLKRANIKVNHYDHLR